MARRAWNGVKRMRNRPVVGLVGNLASDDFNLLRREMSRFIRSEVVAISEETRR